MDKVENVRLVEMGQSNFIKPYRILFKQNKKDRIWDGIKVHDSVSVLIYNVTRKKIIVVKQFRPVVYVCNTTNNVQEGISIDTNKNPGTKGITYELCAGIIDKDKSDAEIVKDEILEECGYDVPIENIEKITKFKSSVGIAGCTQTLFYAEVTDDMKKTEGGGREEEGELIDVYEIPADECLKFAMDESYDKPVGMIFGLHWFHMYKLK
ncbi:DgyrCDS7760 [Dimorphilus gyrociliatus]|uniref:Uridine diphosphate glucose pyrophosphatase NUDT14 n=1 Tax=Dimorphilus gyrociliatus TaxID=2664684 RepID=A0A7I8VT28_9ANNE|nr:DgyrCDS7760 [Dimorphilus gyrociliatus]